MVEEQADRIFKGGNNYSRDLFIDVLYVSPYDADKPERIEGSEDINLIISSLSEHSMGRLLSDGFVLVSDPFVVDVLKMLTGYGMRVSRESLWIVSATEDVSWSCIKCCFGPCCTPCPECCEGEDHSPKRSYSLME